MPSLYCLQTRWVLGSVLAIALMNSASDRVLAQTPIGLPDRPIPPAQDLLPPRSVTPSPQPPTLLPPPTELLQPPGSPLVPSDTLSGEVPGTITVQEFEIKGSTVFSPEELANITAPFTQRPITLAELFQVRSAITQLYLERGYVNSGAYIPPQRLQSGKVEIRVVEGSIEEIQVVGTRRLDPNYVRGRLAIATTPPLNRVRLLEALQLLQLNPLIQTVSAELSAGSRPGSSLLSVEVAEADSLSGLLGLDNGRSPSVGTLRRRIQLSEANLLGLGDGITLGYANTDGSNSLDASYSLPINPQNGTLSFSYGSSSSNVIEPPFNQLDINASSRYYELTLRQPLIQSPNQEFALGLTASRRESEASLLGGELPFPALGADPQGRTRVSALRFFQEWTQRGSQEVFALRSQLSFGLGAFDATINAAAPDSRFVAWRGQGQYVRLLAPETLLLVRADLQFADRSLVALEQFGLGGQDSVRGYRQDLLLTDNGLFASAEVRLPILRLPELESVVQLAPFVDFGTGWNTVARTTAVPETLASVGLGLRWQWGDRLTARFDWGIPLVFVDARKTTWQENGLYFLLSYTPF